MDVLAARVRKAVEELYYSRYGVPDPRVSEGAMRSQT
jgi:hypothetical protein